MQRRERELLERFRQLEGREQIAMSGTDWAILARRRRPLRAVDLASPPSETAFTRMNRIRALALAEERQQARRRLATMLEHPEQTLNVVLLLVLVAQLTSGHAPRCAARGHRRRARRRHRHRAADRPVLRGRRGRAEDVRDPAHRTRRAAVTPLLWFLTNFAPLRWSSRGLIGVANVVLPGKGLKQGPFVTEEEIRTMADVAAERGRHRGRGAQAHPLDLRVRRHRGARGDAAAPRHGGGRRRRHHRGRRIELAIDGGFSRLPACEGVDRQHRRARVPEGPRRAGPAPAKATQPVRDGGAPRGVRARAEARRRAAARDADAEVPHGDRGRRARRHRGARHARGSARGDRRRDRRRVRRRDARRSSTSPTARCAYPGARRSTR